MKHRWSAAYAALFLGLCWLCWPRTYLEIRSDDQALHCFIAAQNFSLQWRHSVEKTLWQEDYQVQAQHLQLTHTRIEGFGAGVPAHLTVVKQTPQYIEFRVQQTLPELNWVVSSNIQAQIIIAQHQWPIYQNVADYQTILIRPRHLLRWQTWQQGACL